MNLELQGKVAVVTGGSKGIGLAVAAALLDEGAHVVTSSRTSTPELDALAARGATVVLADITEAGTPQRLVDAALSAYGRLDVLVNNVGAGSARSSFLDVDDAEWARIFDVTFFSVVRTSRAALPALLENGGTIVNISSINARLPFPTVVDYSAAKAAVTNLTKALSEEFAPRGVRVNAVSPGPVRTPFWTGQDGMAHSVAAGAGVTAQQALDEVVPQSMGISTGRVTEAREVADLVLFLASARSANTTGAEFILDGGQIKTI
ncbi:oxidoreductase [Microbispora bryophytorum]|uniref:3-oxoacyl-ACP reductase n=1 Tax=Microbispora bryophytorum TaxID=1460882 RepID=A0A8H9GVD2_9ACTN|nr:oxidoreductase [Microbispora bryophytorum]MBD3139639.1 SDR family oxidoreductase [Microbispora bryophytorum]TQS02924.1 SDR family oxidoreductase [Microbispora bryophytorum]GGO03068.1 3-oxoacyl-ACP reductase [Microbispora bryophytorum]